MFWINHVHPEDRPGLIAELEGAELNNCRVSEYRFRHANDNWHWIHDEASAVHDETGTIVNYIGSWTDITTNKLAKSPELSSEALYKEAQRIANIGHWVWNIVEDSLEWSDEVYRMFDIEIQSFTPTYGTFIQYVHPDDRELVNAKVNSAINEKQPYSYDHKILLPDGTEKTVHERAEVTFDDDGRPLRMAGTVLDITERKQTEDKLRQLAERVAESETRERRALAMALHDTIAQDLALSILKLSTLRESMRNQEHRQQLDVVVAMLHESSTSLRGTIFELSSPILYELGLEAALRALSDQLSTRHNLSCEIRTVGEFTHLCDATLTALYQCSRELLMNIVKHAQSGNACVTIEASPSDIRVEIQDDGIGVDVGEKRGIGLLYVKERMNSIGGQLRICPAETGGTCSELSAPLE
jgi:signal transduction histidine kinase